MLNPNLSRKPSQEVPLKQEKENTLNRPKGVCRGMLNPNLSRKPSQEVPLRQEKENTLNRPKNHEIV